ncbi:unnamed protein product [Phytophthora fragariaefolia]|uniref:Unnamed protein product n=1 Tax=Phytophthora fragariaefolia TaxID=1490495 RepID=A0A9W6XDM9_9STRA|nr:unnamed protein product [Phytophthora fragariaefolia]
MGNQKDGHDQAQKTMAEERRQSISGAKFTTLADVVQAAAAFDRNGRIHLNFSDDDEKYDISELQARAKHHEAAHCQANRHSSKTVLDVPSLVICIMIVGTHGDVQPFVAIAKRLIQDGHRVRLATHAVYRDFVMSHGVEFYPLGGDPKELAAYMVKTGGHLIPFSLEVIQKDVPRNMQMIEEIIHSTWPAVSAADPDGGGPGIPGKPFRAQAIIANPVSYGHIHVAERLGVPLHIMFPQPWVPTTAFPHPLSNLPYTGKPTKVNYMSYKLVDLLMWQGTESMVNAFRTDKLGLRKIRKGDGGRDILLDLAIPHAFMWSTHLVPKPNDWGKIYDVIGTVTLQGTSSSYTPSPELETFLGDDGGPIFVGFGSMVLQDPKGVTKMIIEAADQARVRVLVQSSWSNMAGDLVVPDNIFFLGNCPHDWLMPRVSAVVHHGGAGTTAAGLLAGKPTFIVPFFGDQPFWGRAVMDAGVGVEPCPISQLTVEKLRVAFQTLESPQLRARAIAMRDHMRREDGVGEAVTSFYRNLPLHHMRCDLNCGRAATLWSKKDKIRLCNECEFVVTSRPKNSPADIVVWCARSRARVWCQGHHCQAAEGYRQEGAKGAVIGLVKGLGGLMISPLVGTMVFADHIATGVYNNSREKNERKKGSLITGNNKVLNALGFKSRGVRNGAMSADEVVEGEQSLPSQIAIDLSPDERIKLVDRFHALMKERKIKDQRSFETPSDSESDSSSGERTEGSQKSDAEQLPSQQPETQPNNSGNLNGKPLPPKMNICMIVTGSWKGSVQQFVAIGLRLQTDGHFVRIATNSIHRDRVVRVGLAFYPLGGNEFVTDKFVQYLHQHAAQNKVRRKSWFLDGTRHRDQFSEMKGLRELVFSLWPACVEADPLEPGKSFRADAIIAHPYAFGQSIVAERLGVPLHCLSEIPLSRTQAFPYLPSSSSDFQLSYHYSVANEVTYDIVDRLVWNAVTDIFADFRYFLGLTGRSTTNNFIAEWQIPCTYLPRPKDWGSKITIAGYVELSVDLPMENVAFSAVDKALQSFAHDHVGTPIIYFSLTRSDWDQRQIRELVGTLDVAVQSANVRVIFQCFESSNVPLSFSCNENGTVFTVNHNFPRQRILPHVHATVHDGGLSMVSECLAAAKPGGIVSRNCMQRALGQALVLLGVGVKPMEANDLMLASLVHTFQALIDPKLANRAKYLAAKLTTSTAVEAAVSAFYNNLPVAAMTCDLDPTRIARRYENAGDLKYKPLKYSLHHPPKFSLRQLDGERLHSPTDENARKDKPCIVYWHGPTAEENEKIVGGSPRQRRPSLLRGPSMAPVVVEMPIFGSSPEDQAKHRAVINGKYEQILRGRESGDRSSTTTLG